MSVVRHSDSSALYLEDPMVIVTVKGKVINRPNRSHSALEADWLKRNVKDVVKHWILESLSNSTFNCQLACLVGKYYTFRSLYLRMELKDTIKVGPII